MTKLIIQLFGKMERSGLIETVYLLGAAALSRTQSVLKIIGLRLRGYVVYDDVILGRNVQFFQSRKGSVCVMPGTTIGNGVRLKAGFSGQIHIGRNVLIEDYTAIFAHKKLTVGDNTMISTGCFITDFNHKYPHSRHKHLLLSEEGYVDKTTTIGKHVWIGANACILAGVTIGDDAVIGAGSVVTKSVPAGSVFAGNPARSIKES